MLLRSIALAVLALLFSPFLTKPIVAQQAQANSSASDPDNVDARAFAFLFRRINNYEAKAKTAASPDKPEARLGTVVPRMFQLNKD